MEVGKLTVQHRSKTGKGISRSTRRDGDVPGVCYGFGMEAPLAVTLNVKALKASFDPERRRNTVIDLTIEGDANVTVKAMVWDFQVHPIRQTVTHVDLKAIDPNKIVEAVVPIVSTGVHKGLIEGGLLTWSRHEVKLRSKPMDIPTKITLDIRELMLGDVLHLSDLVLPEGVKLAELSKLTIVTCIAPKGLKSEKDADAAEGKEPEKKVEAKKPEAKKPEKK